MVVAQDFLQLMTLANFRDDLNGSPHGSVESFAPRPYTASKTSVCQLITLPSQFTIDECDEASNNTEDYDKTLSSKRYYRLNSFDHRDP